MSDAQLVLFWTPAGDQVLTVLLDVSTNGSKPPNLLLGTVSVPRIVESVHGLATSGESQTYSISPKQWMITMGACNSFAYCKTFRNFSSDGYRHPKTGRKRSGGSLVKLQSKSRCSIISFFLPLGSPTQRPPASSVWQRGSSSQRVSLTQSSPSAPHHLLCGHRFLSLELRHPLRSVIVSASHEPCPLQQHLLRLGIPASRAYVPVRQHPRRLGQCHQQRDPRPQLPS